MSSKILRGGKAKLYIDGKLVGTFGEVTWTPASEVKPYGVYEMKYEQFPNHTCNNCGNSWTLSSDDSTCMNCDSKDIDHGDPKKHNR